MKIRKLPILLALIMILTVFSACGNKNTTDEAKPEKPAAANEEKPVEEPKEEVADNEEPAKEEAATGEKKFIIWNIVAEPKSWDPTTNSASTADEMCAQLFEGLTYRTVDGFGPGVAKEWEVSDDGLTYTFHLRDNAKWSDGSPVTAKDFEYSWKRMADPKVASDALTAVTDYIEGAEEFFKGEGSKDDMKVDAVDDYTLVVKLKNPAPFFPQLVANDVYMPVKEEVVEKTGEGWEKKPETCIGNGAFKMTEYQIGSHFIFEKNEHYWDADNVELDGIKLVMVNDANTSLQAYQKGEIDITTLIPPEEVPRLIAEDPNMNVIPIAGCYYIFFNCDVEPTNNLDVRKAITYAIDRKAIVEQVTKKGEVPATGILAPQALKTDGSSYRELDPKTGYPVPQYGIDPNKANIEEAKAALAAAGYPDGEGFPEIELLYNTSDIHKPIMEAIQQMLKDNLNINVTLRNEETSVYWNTLDSGKFVMARGGWSNHPYDAGGLIKQFGSQNGNNCSQWRYQPYVGAPHDEVLNPGNEAFDIAFNKAMSSLGEQRDAAWVEAEEAIMADLPMAPIYYLTSSFVINRDRVDGDIVTPTGSFVLKNASLID